MRIRAYLIGLLAVLCVAVPAPAPPVTLMPPAQAGAAITPAPTGTRPLALGDSGADVYALKQRMQYLGYFNQATSLSARMTDVTLERINELLMNNDLEPVELITTEIQNMILARDDLALGPTPTPSPTPEPLLMPVTTAALPALDAEGFLPDADGEYIYQDDADGLWYYISHTLYINIRRYNDLDAKNIWYETEVKTRGGEQLQSFLTRSLRVYERPVTIARKHSAVLAFTDDYFSLRKYGVAIRAGDIYRDAMRGSNTAYPPGDTLAVFADGSMRAFVVNAHTAAEFLDMGAVHVLTFGPWLISGGIINPMVSSDTYMYYREPRSAIGMIAPGHYLIVTVDGRYTGAKGVYFSWLTKRMQEVGVTEAINLDGGGTTALVFMGVQLSRVSTAKPSGANTRRVTSMLGFGVSEAVPEVE